MRVLKLLALAVLLTAGPANAAGVSEYSIKSAYLLNFAKLASWPASAFPGPEAPLVIGIRDVATLLNLDVRQVDQVGRDALDADAFNGDVAVFDDPRAAILGADLLRQSDLLAQGVEVVHFQVGVFEKVLLELLEFAKGRAGFLDAENA